MSNPISSTANNRVVGREAAAPDTVNNTSEINRIKTADALKKAEMTGLKVSVGDEQMVRRIERALKALQSPSTSCEISVHEQTNAIMIKIINNETRELIREIPPEKTLDIVGKMLEINGLLVDERV